MKKKVLSLNITPEVEKGVYSNLVVMAHSSSEFILDFCNVMPNQKMPTVVSRIILGPEHAKKLLLTLQENVRKYEEIYGTIKMPNWEKKTAKPFKLGSQGDA